jgi:hypothetical protein
VNEIPQEIQAVLDLAIVAGVPVKYSAEDGGFIFGNVLRGDTIRVGTADSDVNPVRCPPLLTTQYVKRAALWISEWRPEWKIS